MLLYGRLRLVRGDFVGLDLLSSEYLTCLTPESLDMVSCHTNGSTQMNPSLAHSRIVKSWGRYKREAQSEVMGD